ncbi:MAG: pantoate--beta-alanine ligase [Thermodesulfobacteriota bacterium]
MKIIEDPREMREYSASFAARGLAPVLVPTMGYLHDGHRRLLRVGKSLCQDGRPLVLSIFVNPAQFGPAEDFAAYPRDMDRDAQVARAEGVDVVFAPRPDSMYPEGFQTFVEVPELSAPLCGAFRPGHFRGVATVVLKLFNIVAPARAVFGRKDYQQLLVIKRMVRDLDLGVEVVGVDTVREPDGLAMSSRNAYLGPAEREAALCIPRALDAAQSALCAGEGESAVLVEKMKKVIEKEPSAVIEYIDVRDAETLAPVDRVEAPAVVALAVRIGATRLIDNRLLSR